MNNRSATIALPHSEIEKSKGSSGNFPPEPFVLNCSYVALFFAFLILRWADGRDGPEGGEVLRLFLQSVIDGQEPGTLGRGYDLLRQGGSVVLPPVAQGLPAHLL